MLIRNRFKQFVVWFLIATSFFFHGNEVDAWQDDSSCQSECVQLVVHYDHQPMTTTDVDTDPHPFSTIEVLAVPELEKETYKNKWLEKPTVTHVEVAQELDHNVIDEEQHRDTMAVGLDWHPNDPYFDQQVRDFQMIGVEDAWHHFRPKEKVTVAVIDSGVRADHPDLAGQLLEGWNVLANDEAPTDPIGHGTHVSGIIGARTNNEEGGASVSSGYVRLLPIKVFDDEQGSSVHLAQAIVYAVDEGADIINLSLGMKEDSQMVHEAIQYAEEHDVLLIGAVGNEGLDQIAYPAAYPEVIAVSAVDSQSGKHAAFSNVGTKMELAAPGVHVLSTYHLADEQYETLTGTSMATAYVSSLAAMIKAHEPSLRSEQVRRILQQTSITTGEGLQTTSGDDVGVIHAGLAVNAIDVRYRLFGKNAIETALTIAKHGWLDEQPPADEHVENEQDEQRFVVFASHMDFADALTGTPLAYRLQAPLLLTGPETVDEAVLNYLEEWHVTDVVLLGGSEAIDHPVATALQEAGYDVHRLHGSNRYATAAAINTVLIEGHAEWDRLDGRKAALAEIEDVGMNNGEAGASTSVPERVMITSGENFADALASAQFAASEHVPIALVQADHIPEETARFLETYAFKEAIIIGGSSAVSTAIEEQLENTFELSTVRLGGADRYETLQIVVDYFDASYDHVVLASGETFRDALPGANYAAQDDAVLLLTRHAQLPTVIEEILASRAEAGTFTSFDVLGGSQAIDSAVVWQVDDIMHRAAE